MHTIRLYLLHMEIRRKNVFILTALVSTGILIYGLSAAREYYGERQERKAAFKSLSDFSAICLQKFPAKTDSQKIRNLRHCLYVNTLFSTDKKHTELWNQKDKMADWLFDYASKTRGDPPPMECSNRAGTLVTMLNTQGYQAHDIVVARDEDNFDDHVVTEVLNPDTKKWEVQGSSYDVEYVTKKDRKNLNLQQMLSLDTSEYMPCNFEGRCGWDLVTSEGMTLAYNRGYWNTGWVKAQRTLYISKRFDENKIRPVYGKQLSYCQWRAKWCDNIVHLE